MLRIPALAVSLALVAAGLSGCSLFEDLGGGDLDDALELTTGEATTVRFVHRQAMAERLGIDDIEPGASKKDTRRYVETLLDEGGSTGATDFAMYLDLMAKDAAFSELDIVWAASGSAGSGVSEALPRVYKLHEDLDLEEVGADLVETGYAEDEIDGHPHYSIDPVDTEFDGTLGAYPAAQMSNVVLLPDEHLMFVAGTRETAELAVEVFEDDADSVTDVGTFDDVLEGFDVDLEYAWLAEGPDCGYELPAGTTEEPGRDELGTPEVAGMVITAEDAGTSSALAFADDDAAEADLDAREAYLDGAFLVRTGQRLSSRATSWELERDGSVVRINYDYDDPGLASDAAVYSDGFHACNPG